MESLFTNEGLTAMKQRINKLSPESPRQWGKMDHTQMLEHCRKVMQTAVEEVPVRVPLIAKLIGPMLKRKFLREGAFGKNSPTGGEFKTFTGNKLEEEKTQLLAMLDRFSKGGKEGKLTVRHPFFGKVSQDEWDKLQAIHLNHHLTQFSA